MKITRKVYNFFFNFPNIINLLIRKYINVKREYIYEISMCTYRKTLETTFKSTVICALH